MSSFTLSENREVSTNYVPRPLQYHLHTSLKRFNVVVCHRRFGKTIFSLNHMIDRALRCTNPMPRFAYLAPNYGQAKRVVWDQLKHYTSNIPGIEPNEADLRVDIPANKSRIMLLSAENPASLKGIYLDGVILDEYAEMNPAAWSEVIRPTLSDRKGWAIFIGTPKGQNNFYKLYDYALHKTDPEWFAALYRASETGILDASELESARRTMTEDEYEQEYECFPAGTLVATRRGHIPIEEIRRGDSVLTHRNRWRPVTATMSKRFSGDLVKIKSFGSQAPITCTPEHPFLVHDRVLRTRIWKKASDLVEGDCLILPKAKSGPQVLSEEYTRLLAWFICEGSVSGNTVAFSLNPHNVSEISEVKNLLRFLGFESSWIGGSLLVYNVALADLLTGWCGSGAAGKHIPFDLISGHEEVFFDTLIKGDGCVVETTQGGKRFAFTTISRPLAFDLQLLSGMLGRRAGITIRPAQAGVIEGRKVWCQKSYLVQISFGFKVNHSRLHEVFPTKLGIAFRVRKVQREASDCLVFNLSVKEDESYVVEGKAVHNCSFNAGLSGAYFAKELSRAEKENRIGTFPYDPMLPVDTYWDLGIDDLTSIWFVQSLRGRHRIVDYHEVCGESISEVVATVKKRPYVLGEWVFPHDAQARDFSTGKAQVQVFQSLGCRPTRIVPRVGTKREGINAARMVFAKCEFDRVKCDKGLKALGNYQRKWNSKNNVFEESPLHNWASNGADAFQQFALGVRERSGDSYSERRFYDGRSAMTAETHYDPFKRGRV